MRLAGASASKFQYFSRSTGAWSTARGPTTASTSSCVGRGRLGCGAFCGPGAGWRCACSGCCARTSVSTPTSPITTFARIPSTSLIACASLSLFPGRSKLATDHWLLNPNTSAPSRNACGTALPDRIARTNRLFPVSASRMCGQLLRIASISLLPAFAVGSGWR